MMQVDFPSPEELGVIASYIVLTMKDKGLDITIDHGRIRATILNYLTDPNKAVFVLRAEQGNVVGAFMGCVIDHLFTKHDSAAEQFVYLDPRYRTFLNLKKLVRAFEGWAMSFPNVGEIRFGFYQPSDVDRYTRLFEALGYHLQSHVLAKRIA